MQDGETQKSVLRQHQRRAIDAILDRCADPAKTRGLVWHTQGSGKTFTLLTAARLILEDKARFANATAILVVDRIELEGQLKGWVERLLGEMQQQDIPSRERRTRTELQALLDADFRGLIVSMIHKFEAVRKNSSLRDNVYVFIDEAHRSVADGTRDVSHGGRAQGHDCRIHRHADRSHLKARWNIQNLRHAGRAVTWTSTPSASRSGRDDAADQVQAGA